MSLQFWSQKSQNGTVGDNAVQCSALAVIFITQLELESPLARPPCVCVDPPQIFTQTHTGFAKLLH